MQKLIKTKTKMNFKTKITLVCGLLCSELFYWLRQCKYKVHLFYKGLVFLSVFCHYAHSIQC